METIVENIFISLCQIIELLILVSIIKSFFPPAVYKMCVQIIFGYRTQSVGGVEVFRQFSAEQQLLNVTA